MIWAALAAPGTFAKPGKSKTTNGCAPTSPDARLKAEIAGRSVQDVSKDMLAIAREGLKRRNRLSERWWTKPTTCRQLDEIAASGVTQAERLLELYHGPGRAM